MASVAKAIFVRTRGSVWQTPWMQVRHEARIQSRNPREPHFDKKLMLAVCEPVYVIRTPPWMRCSKQVYAKKNEVEVHPLEKLLAAELKKEWENSEMICFFHVNHITEEEKKAVRNMLFKQNMFLKTYNNKTVRYALEGTPNECVLHLFQSNNAIVFSPEPQVAKLLSLTRKMPQFILLAGIVDNRLFHRAGLIEYSCLPSLDVLHGQLCSLLASAAQQVSQSLTHHQQSLCTNLGSYVKQNTSENEQ